MKMRVMILSVCLFSAVICTTCLADNKESFSRSRLDIAVPPEVWQQKGNGANNSIPCPKCCVYQNHSYSEGSVIEITGGRLQQCMRDKNVTGTNNLIWQLLPQKTDNTG